MTETEQMVADTLGGWLFAHGHANLKMDQDGVGVDSNPVRVWAQPSEVAHHGPEQVVAEMQVRVLLPDGREVLESVSGMGRSEDEAQRMALMLFLSVTFHPIYKACINSQDGHMLEVVREIGGKQRPVIHGNLQAQFEGDGPDLDIPAIQDLIFSLLPGLELSDDMHWIKFVHGRIHSDEDSMTLMVDNVLDDDLANQVEAFEWPDGPPNWLLKQFILVLEPGSDAAEDSA